MRYAVEILENNWYDMLPMKDENTCAGFCGGFCGFFGFFCCCCWGFFGNTTELFQVMSVFILENQINRLILPWQPDMGSSEASVCFYN